MRIILIAVAMALAGCATGQQTDDHTLGKLGYILSNTAAGLQAGQPRAFHCTSTTFGQVVTTNCQ